MVANRYRGILLAAALGAGQASFADKQVLHLAIDGEFDEELRRALVRVISPSSIEALVDFERFDPNKLCDEEICTDDKIEPVAGFQAKSNLAKAGQQAYPVIEIDEGIVFSNLVSYAVVESRQIPAIQRPDGEGRLLVPLSKQRLEEAKNAGVVTETPLLPGFEDTRALIASYEPRSSLMQKMAEEFEKFGSIQRQIQFSVDATEEDINQAIALVSERKAGVMEAGFTNEFAWPDDAIIFQADSEECQIEETNWPYETESISTVINDNLARLEQWNVVKTDRTRVLIVDTGIGESLTSDPQFKELIDQDLPELLQTNYYFRGTSAETEDRQCLDVDNLSSSSPLGFAPNDNNDTWCHMAYENPLHPLPHIIGDEDYLPYHGSFVSMLAIGGQDLLQSDVSFVRNLIGLRFARVTRKSEHAATSVRTEVDDLRRAIDYAVNSEVDIINLSLKVENPSQSQRAAKHLKEFEGLIVASAGNQPVELTIAAELFPATVVGDVRSRTIVVAAASRDDEGMFSLWHKSSYSSELVDIAAPGSRVPSVNDKNQRVCMSGTSAAAPQITFVAAALKAFGLKENGEVKRRVISTATRYESLKKSVKEGGVLNAQAALDIYRDLIWTDGNLTPIAGRLEPMENVPLYPACRTTDSALKTNKGYIDFAMLQSWTSAEDGQARFSARLSGGLSDHTCQYDPSKQIGFILPNGHTDYYDLSRIDRLVPSPFRERDI